MQRGRGVRVKSVAASTWHSLVLAENNAVYAFGRCQHGQLGLKCKYGDNAQVTPQPPLTPPSTFLHHGAAETNKKNKTAQYSIYF